MSRLFISMKRSPIVEIEFSEDVADTFKPTLIEFFGVNFIKAETFSKGLYRYEFETDKDTVEDMKNKLTAFYNSRITREIDIDIDLN